MTSQSRFYTPIPFSGDLEVKQNDTCDSSGTIIAGVRKPNKLNVQQHSSRHKYANIYSLHFPCTLFVCIPLQVMLHMQNPGSEEPCKVELLVLQRQLAPVSQHWYKIGLQLKAD